MPKETLIDLIRAAVKDITEHGASETRLDQWRQRLALALRFWENPSESESRLARSLKSLFEQKTTEGSLSRILPGVDKYSLSNIRYEFKNELDKRILASADLIKLNRDQAITRTLQRFSGWSTSVPASGSNDNLSHVVKDIAKPLRSMKFEERRLFIDQGHKMISNIQYVAALQSESIAGRWRSHWRQAGYDYREDHKERDEKVYAVRDSWALQEGYINRGDGILEDNEMPAEAPFCRCFVVYSRNLRDLPASMLTAKGKKALEESRLPSPTL